MKADSYYSLASRLSTWIIPLGALILITVLSMNYYLSRVLLDNYIERLTSTTASASVRKIETIFNSATISAQSLAATVSATQVTNQQIQQMIAAFIDANPVIFGMAVALEPDTLKKSQAAYAPYYYRDKDTLRYSNLASNNYHYLMQPWYTKSKALKTPLWSEPYLDEGGGEVQMITYSVPIYLADGKTFAGIATADIQLSWLDDVIQEMQIGNNGFGIILSRNDVVIAHSKEAINLTRLSKHGVAPDKWQQYLNSKKTSAPMHFKSSCSKSTSDGDCRFVIQSLADSGWKIVIVLPEKELTAKINRLTTKISIIAIFGLTLLFIVVTLVTRHLTRPLSQLASASREIGAGNLDTKIPEPFYQDEIGSLTDNFSSMRDSLKIYISEVQQATAKQQKLESEIQIAQDIQMSMIPGAGNAYIKNNEYQLFALLRPARTVGGDLYYYQQCDEVLHFILGDVSDKGVPAALFMAKTITLYTRALRDKLSPGQTFNMMNDVLAQNNDACMFVTALCGNINLKTGAVVMSNAGHMEPIIKNAQTTNEFKINGATALGLMEDVDYPDVTFQLAHQASIIMYTDGISEAHDSNNNQYSDEKLITLITTADTSSVKETGKTIIDSVDNFASNVEQFDDITLLIIRYE